MDRYLTPELKCYYMKDLNQKVVPLTDGSWKLDDGVLKYLQLINNNPLVQTLYSKKYSSNTSLSGEEESYLMFAYSKELEDVVFKNFLSRITSAFSSGEGKCYFVFNYPRFEEADGIERLDIGCVSDGNYFNVNRVSLYFEDYDEFQHIQFWEFISKELSVLGQNS